MRASLPKKLSSPFGWFGPGIYIGAALLSLLGLIWLVHPLRSSPEPVYGGKTAAQWLDAGYEDASQALQLIGPPAVPVILAKLTNEDPQYGSWRRYREFWNRMPPTVRNLLSAPKSGAFDELHACSILVEMGPSVIPQLASALRDRNPAVREASAQALGRFGQQGKNLSQARPFLIGALHDPVPGVRLRAAEALEQQPRARPPEK